MGETKQAVAQMLQIAELQVEGLDGEEAARTLQEALALDPENATATKMLRELGYELVEEPDDADPSSGDSQEDEPRAAIGQAYDPEAPLPSYDLEEIGPEDVARRSYPEPTLHGAAAQAGAAAASARSPRRHRRPLRGARCRAFRWRPHPRARRCSTCGAVAVARQPPKKSVPRPLLR